MPWRTHLTKTWRKREIMQKELLLLPSLFKKAGMSPQHIQREVSTNLQITRPEDLTYATQLHKTGLYKYKHIKPSF